MKTNKLLLLGIILTIGPTQIHAEDYKKLVDLINETKTCAKDEYGLNCKYVIGSTLNIEIRQVGSANPNIFFYESSRRGVFYAGYNFFSQCVVIMPGKKDRASLKLRPIKDDAVVAYISLKTGKAYRTYVQCEYDAEGMKPR